MIALAVAYVFSAFIIITAILELAFKRVLGVLVFATDLETGQRSKVVLSDILQCYLTVGFQGFGLSMFAMFINFLNSGQGISTNIFIKTIAYICAVFVLIKGSGTVMRYFGVDIGLKEGYGQLASAFGMGAMLFRKGSNGFNRAKGSGNGNGSDSGEGEDRKPEKNFGETLSKKAGKTGRALGYAHERGLSGLASDGATMASERATKPLIAKQRGISRADVCRERLKGLKYEPPLLAEDDRVVLTKQLNQIGNNLNQAVKALNIIAKYFREESEDKKEKSLHFSFDASRYNIFKDELANSIAEKLMISYPDDIFLESNRSAPSFFKLSEVEKEYFEYWIEKQTRPGTKEEYSQKVDRNLIHSIQIIASLKDEVKQLWELL